jgi:hypothetical protein
MIKCVSLQGWKEVENIQINKCSTTHTQNQREKVEHHLNRDKKSLWPLPFIIKALKKLRIQGTFLNIIKAIYDKPIVNKILTVEKLKPFPLKSGMRQGCPYSSLLFTVIPEPNWSNKTGKKIKEIQIRKEEVELV